MANQQQSHGHVMGTGSQGNMGVHYTQVSGAMGGKQLNMSSRQTTHNLQQQESQVLQ